MTNEQYQTEAEFLRAITELAQYKGWWVYHTFDSRRSEPGFPDLVLIRPPQLLFIEVKSQRGKITRAQKRCMDLLMAANQAVYIVKPSDWDKVVVLLGA